MATLKVTVRESKDCFEGSVSIPGLRTTKLVRKDGSTSFPNTSALKTTARGLATRLGMTVEYVERKAAKKSIKSKTAKACKTTKTCKCKKAKSSACCASTPTATPTPVTPATT